MELSKLTHPNLHWRKVEIINTQEQVFLFGKSNVIERLNHKEGVFVIDYKRREAFVGNRVTIYYAVEGAKSRVYVVVSSPDSIEELFLHSKT